MNLKEAVKIMKAEVKNEYALAYIKSLDDVVDHDGMHGLVVQVRYIKENLKGWRGENAREVKAFLTEWIKLKEKNEG
jgi:hypothetical protein